MKIQPKQIRSLLVKRLQNASPCYRLSDDKIGKLLSNLSDDDLLAYTSQFHSVKELAEWISLLATNTTYDKGLPNKSQISSFLSSLRLQTGNPCKFTVREAVEMMLCFTMKQIVSIVKAK